MPKSWLKGRVGGDHPHAKPVVSTCLITGAETRYAAASDARRDGFTSQGISACCLGKVKSHHGRAWRFADEPILLAPPNAGYKISWKETSTVADRAKALRRLTEAGAAVAVISYDPFVWRVTPA